MSARDIGSWPISEDHGDYTVRRSPHVPDESARGNTLHMTEEQLIAAAFRLTTRTRLVGDRVGNDAAMVAHAFLVLKGKLQD